MRRKLLLGIVSLLLISTVLAGCSSSDEIDVVNYPNDDITITVGYAAGGATDLVVRPFADLFSNKAGVNVVVENLTGASGAVAAQEFLTERPDGYRLLMAAAPNMTIVPIATGLDYTYEDFTPIAQLTHTPIAIAVNIESPYQTWEEFLEGARSQTLTYSSGGANSTDQIAMEIIAKEEGVTFNHMPYDGGSEATAALLGNHVDSTVGSLPDVLGHHNGGTIKILAVFADERQEVVPDVPSIKELGYDNMAYGAWTSLVGPPDMPQEIVDYLEAMTEEVISDPGLQDAWKNMNVYSHYLDAEGLAQKIADVDREFGAIVREQMED